ncbi:MAG: hypothetical protein II062_02670 [Oscillospiraceae bacterium]|nr:hypothetical protein [Oscillospiraceae bacterium]
MERIKTRRGLRVLYELAVLLAALCLLWAALFQLGCAMMPERSTYGAVWSSYLQEEENTVDVLFLGSSRAYCNVIPARIYEDTGVSSYVMAGPSQTVSLSYYYLRECLKTQRPRCVLMELSGGFYGRVEEHSKANVCYMPAGLNRLRAARCCEDGILELALFPLQEFHYRIYDADFGQTSDEEGLMLCGYTPLEEATPQSVRSVRETKALPGTELYAENLSWLLRIAALCEENDIRCVFYLAPTMQPYPEEATARLCADLREQSGAAVEDWSGLSDALRVDPETDWYDAIHFNRRGAEKFSGFLSDYLRSLGLPRSERADEALWSRRIAYAAEARNKK